MMGIWFVSFLKSFSTGWQFHGDMKSFMMWKFYEDKEKLFHFFCGIAATYDKGWCIFSVW